MERLHPDSTGVAQLACFQSVLVGPPGVRLIIE
jgi:hypothetical protein